MSDEGSPSLLNLRGFRIQKKLNLSHTPALNGSLNSSSECSPDLTSVKRRIMPLQESDSECEVVTRAEWSDPEVIEINDDDEADAANAQIASAPTVNVARNEVAAVKVNETVKATKNERTVVTTSVTITTANQNSNDSTGSASNSNTSYYSVSTRPRKSEAVLEKERQMRFLREKYPSMESMAIHDVLSKHNFDIDKAIEELEIKQKDKEKKKVSAEDFATWKAVQEKKEEMKAQQETQKIIVQTQQFQQQIQQQSQPQPQHSQVAARKRTIGEFSNSTKKKAKRLRTEAVSDESDIEVKEYKDNRVFDSDEDSDVEISNELTGDKKKVLEFFQTATSNELQLMSSCSKKKAECIIECRPFESWIDLVNKLSLNKNLSPAFLNSAQDVLVTRSNVQQLMKKCKNLAQQMERAIAAGAGVKRQPALLDPSKQLTSYQMVGLNWLAVLHAQGVNGILADEMGLGKTIQVIAFLAHLKEIGATKGIPHLIVVPSSTLDNWRVEFEKWCPSMNVFMYYGTTEERKMYRIEYWSKGNLSNYDVILTTYSMVTSSPEEKKMFRVTQMHYVVFDEAHMLKNMNTQRYENLIRIKAMNRILLTGTPLQNNLLELMSLLIFVMPAMFAGKSDDLKSLFQKNSKAKRSDEEDLPAFERKQIKHAKDIMKPFVLRRLKQDVLQDLPQKTDELIKVPLAPTQLEQYQNLVHHFQNIGKEPSENGTYSGMTMMSDLRKLSNHPLLLKYFYQYEDLTEMAKLLAADPTYKGTVVQYIIDDLSCMSDFEIHTLCKQHKSLNKFELPDNLILTSGKFIYLDRKLAELKEGGHRVLIFSQYVIMLNVMEEYLQLRNYTYLRLDGTTPVTTRQELIDQYTSDPDIFIFLLSTRAGGLGINLTAADTVIIHDIDFNPYNDKQAEDRCHRMGQMKPVKVYRLVSQRTIEELMWQMNQEKLKLEKEVTADEAESPDVKSVVRLLSSALGIDSQSVTQLVTAKPASNS